MKFGEKLALWFAHAVAAWPRARWIAKIDDDVYACPELFGSVDRAAAPTTYGGWWHDGRGERAPHSVRFVKARMDEAFVVLGRALAENVASRRYCEDRDACPPEGLYDADFGGVSLALWLEAPSVRAAGVARLKLNDRVVDLRNNRRQRAALADADGAPRVDAVDCARFLYYHPIKTPGGLDAAHARALARRANASRTHSCSGGQC